ncbi:hypothetical protein ALC62_04213 [Cyphomyrmex costatus]|uniref:Uncharacterized protein n=1 Tax=Cyphomyrmex costatus TaxID=456900 RepID=A0A195CXF1_9HYME|nr:hypothetical protein ALC62_04213 [Cyphomyrmex costatus]
MRESGDEPSLFSYSSIDPAPTAHHHELSLSRLPCHTEFYRIGEITILIAVSINTNPLSS